MKPQDVLFFVCLGFLLWKANPKWFVIAGIIALIIAMPLFAVWIFFTAERLTWYAAVFFFCSAALYILRIREYNEKGK